ncbi:MAG: TDP-N-acetylfucosamine:lipid II N-acetylfucosaminyltransferase [Bacilli bacterium]|nr:TDP-N-acetylfucosamine:lipid II N-acetylfucosaminyltransferase [Bacilli bacterium]
MKTDKIKKKYIHILSSGSTIFNGLIIERFNNQSLGFNPDDHHFILTNAETYNNFSHYTNTSLDELLISSNMKSFKSYISQSENTFLHCNTLSVWQLFHLNKKELNKIIWVVWGSDLYRGSWVNSFYKKGIRFAVDLMRLNFIRDYKIKQFKAIGIGFKYDAIEVRRRFGNQIKILAAPYGYKPGIKGKLDEILLESVDTYKTRSYKIMIGHSAYPFLNHFDIMNKLKRFKDENIIISLVFSYGDMKYAKKVEDYAINLFGNEKVEVLRELMPIDVYIRYLKSVDACILDYTHQSALGNFYILLYLGKKLFLNGKGILRLSTILEAVEAYSVEEIDKMDFNEFSSLFTNNDRGKAFGGFYIDENNTVMMWKNVFRELE